MRRLSKRIWQVITGALLALILLITGCSATDPSDRQEVAVPERPAVVDTLLQAKQQGGAPVFTVLGSSVTKGVGVSETMEDHWTTMLVKDLRAMNGLEKLEFHNNGYPGITTSKVLSEGRIEEVVGQKPDVLLFETCLLNDYHYEVPIHLTIANLDAIMDKFHKELPETRVILQSPNPRSPNSANQLGFTYEDYLNKTKAHIESKGWEYIDVYSDFERQRQAEGQLLLDVVPEGIHPNRVGYKYWYNAVRDYFFEGS